MSAFGNVLRLIALTLIGASAWAQTPPVETKTVTFTVQTFEVPKTQTNPDGVQFKLVQPGNSTQLKLDPKTFSANQVKVNPNLGKPADFNYGPNVSGWPLCGGAVGGKLQAPCPAEPATFVAEAVGACPKGSFYDPNGSCWACPDGYNRTADPVTSATACSKADPSVALKQMRAQFQGGICPKGAFFDPIRGGECYSCPEGYRRSAAHIDAGNACYIPAGERLAPAKRVKRGIVVCDPGSFYDAWDGGGCWSCPAGYNRTGHHINSAQACSAAVAEQQAHATKQGVAGCKPGEFQDPRNGGECWTCPSATYRTVYPVNEDKACEQRAGVKLEKAQQVSAFSCPAGSFMDLINSRDGNVKARIEQQIKETGRRVDYGKSAGATCWSCPPGFVRSTGHVAGNEACQTTALKWQAAPYKHPGFFGLDGAEDVAIALIKEKTQITTIATSLAPGVNKSPQQMVKETWEEIATAPQLSVPLKMAALARVQAAAVDPGKATPAELRLARSLAEAIGKYRIFLAQNSLDAYDNWKSADGLRRAQKVRTDGPSLGMLFDYGTVPPDFDEIVLGSVLGGLGAHAAAQFAGGMAWTRSAGLKNKIFPHRKAREALSEGRRVIKEAVEEGTEQLAKKVGPKVAQKLGPKLLVKGIEAGAKTVMSSLLMDGPQAIIGFAVDILVEALTQVIDIENARPTLETKLATAKQPVDLSRLMATDEGADLIEGEWTTAMGGDALPKAPLSTYAALAAEAAKAPSVTPPGSSGAPQAPSAPAPFNLVASGGACLIVQNANAVLGSCGSSSWVSSDGASLQPVQDRAKCLTAGPPPGVVNCMTTGRPLPAQHWTFSNGLLVAGNGLCLEARGNTPVLAACNPTLPAQKWQARQ